MARREHRRPRRETQAAAVNLLDEIKALNTSIMLITQKLKSFARNERILSNNLILLNKKITALKNRVDSFTAEGVSEKGGVSTDIEIMKAKIRDMDKKISSLEEKISSLKKKK